MIINRILPIYMSLMLIFSLSFIVHLEAILNLWMKNYLCTVFWRFVSKEEAMEANLICYQNFKRVIWGPYGSVYYDNFVVVSCIWIHITKENRVELALLQITPSTPSSETQEQLTGRGFLGP